MIRAYLLYTGTDGHSHVVRGSISGGAHAAAETVQFKETPAHSSLDWHNAPVDQYVITLSGILAFDTHGGEKFILEPGDVLVATDTTGSGHTWRLINDDPWKRAYVIFREGTATGFVADPL